MAQKTGVLFIINPIAGTKNKTGIPKLIADNLDLTKFNYELEYSKKSGHARELAKAGIDRGNKIIVAVGGDGTVNEVAGAVMHTDSILAIIPHGSGNGLARTMNIPMNTVKAINLINKTNVTKIDAGEANGNPFFCTTGIGFDAHIGKLFAQSTSRGLKTYVNGVLGQFISYEPLSYNISYQDNQIERKAFLITLANAGQWGNNAYVSPEADIRDGKLDMCIMKPFLFHAAFGLAFRMFTKSMHKSRLLEIIRVEEVSIENKIADCYHFDGEHRDLAGPLKIRVIPLCLNLIVEE